MSLPELIERHGAEKARCQRAPVTVLALGLAVDRTAGDVRSKSCGRDNATIVFAAPSILTGLMPLWRVDTDKANLGCAYREGVTINNARNANQIGGEGGSGKSASKGQGQH